MNIALIGYGKMGKEIEKIALERNHNVTLKVDENNINSLNDSDFNDIDVAIEFSVPHSAFSNINLCLDHNIPVVSGTTGWLDKFNHIIERCKKENKAFFYASNYSVGVNLFFKLNKYLAKLMNNFGDYMVEIKETHHTKKIDAPSGTAITLAEDIVENIELKKNWEKETASSEHTIAIKSIREGDVPGNHKIIYESPYDKITVEHDAKSRKGFAMGAVLAAEFVLGKTGYYTMDDMIKF